MNCLIIDDNNKTSETLANLLKENGTFVNVHQADQPYMVRSILTSAYIDVVFIRVRLWDYTMFSKLEAEEMPIIVFLSGGKERITEKESTTVEHQLREPYTQESISRLMRNLIFKPKNERPHFFFVRFEARYHKILFSDVELVERLMGSYVRLHTKATSFLLPGSLSSFEVQLPEELLRRLSDGLIIPKAYEQNVTNNEYHFKGKTYKLTYRFMQKKRNEIDKLIFEA